MKSSTESVARRYGGFVKWVVDLAGTRAEVLTAYRLGLFGGR